LELCPLLLGDAALQVELVPNIFEEELRGLNQGLVAKVEEHQHSVGAWGTIFIEVIFKLLKLLYVVDDRLIALVLELPLNAGIVVLEEKQALLL